MGELAQPGDRPESVQRAINLVETVVGDFHKDGCPDTIFPTMLVEDPSGGLTVGAFMADRSPASKDLQAEIAMQAFRDGAVSVIMFHEAWGVKVSNAEDTRLAMKLNDEGRSLGEHPKAFECVNVSYFAATQELYGIAKILRHEDGCATLGEWEFVNASPDDDGRFVHLYQKARAQWQ